MSQIGRPSPLREIIRPFIDLARAPRALWAVNQSFFLDGFVYFGMLGYLAMYFNQYGHLGDREAGWMVGFLTSGVTIASLFFGGRADRWGIRRTLFASLALMVLGRCVLALIPGLGLAGGSLLSPFTILAFLGLLVLVVGYGMYAPASYASVRRLTTPATSGMGFAMLYGLMNLGGWLPTFMAPVRKHVGIQGAFWLYTGVTLVGLILLLLLLTRKALAVAETTVDAETALDPAPAPEGWGPGLRHWLRNHPLADGKFAFFIFCLIPVQTLFVYNWLVLPQYVERAFAGSWVGARFEVATNLNPLLIFFLCPLVTALTAKGKVYNQMIWGTAIMAAPTFLLALGPTVWGLFTFIVVMSIGEAIWSPRFLQYAADIAPPGRVGAFMGVAKLPWFLTKMIVPIYSGSALARWCPAHAQGATGTMWFVFSLVAMSSTVMLILAKGWLGKDFRTVA